jgi:hypothetical protein
LDAVIKLPDDVDMMKTVKTILSKTNHNASADFTAEMMKTLTDLKKTSAWLPRLPGRLWENTHKVSVSFS